MPDLFAGKLRGGRARLQSPSSGVVWLPGRLPQPDSVANFALLPPLYYGVGCVIYSDTRQKFWISCSPGGAEKAPVVETRSSMLQVYVCACACNLSWACARVAQGLLSLMSGPQNTEQQ